MKKSPITRRKFVKQSSTAAASMALLPSIITSGPQYISPNEQVKFGVIGCKGMGFSNVRSFPGSVGRASCSPSISQASAAQRAQRVRPEAWILLQCSSQWVSQIHALECDSVLVQVRRRKKSKWRSLLLNAYCLLSRPMLDLPASVRRRSREGDCHFRRS